LVLDFCHPNGKKRNPSEVIIISRFAYPAILSKDSAGRVLVKFSDLRGAATDGATEAEAFEEAIDCLGSFLATCMVRKEDIPEPSAGKRGTTLIPVPLWLAPKLALYLAVRAQGINNSELARRLNVRETVVRRMLNPDHETKAEKIQAALAVLGKRLTIEVQDAAA
jgi:antitoxin HicB